jgi:hypothetical protein
MGRVRPEEEIVRIPASHDVFMLGLIVLVLLAAFG